MIAHDHHDARCACPSLQDGYLPDAGAADEGVVV